MSSRSSTFGKRNRTLVMGIVNVTPDSFYDGGRYVDDRVLAHIDEMVAAGADILDIGGESTRPGATPVPAGEQLARVEPAIKYAVKQRGVRVSLDTTLPEVAARGLGWGAHWLNDVSCLADAEIARVAARHGAKLVLMHARPDMNMMQNFSEYPENGYNDVASDVRREWSLARDQAIAAGLRSEDILFDPGIGFSKSANQSLQLMKRLPEFRDLQTTIVIGVSRKSFIGKLDGSPPEKRLGGTVAACVLAALKGAGVVRVHDVQEVRQALDTLSAIESGGAHG